MLRTLGIFDISPPPYNIIPKVFVNFLLKCSFPIFPIRKLSQLHCWPVPLPLPSVHFPTPKAWSMPFSLSSPALSSFTMCRMRSHSNFFALGPPSRNPISCRGLSLSAGALNGVSLSFEGVVYNNRYTGGRGAYWAMELVPRGIDRVRYSRGRRVIGGERITWGYRGRLLEARCRGTGVMGQWKRLLGAR